MEETINSLIMFKMVTVEVITRVEEIKVKDGIIATIILIITIMLLLVDGIKMHKTTIIIIEVLFGVTITLVPALGEIIIAALCKILLTMGVITIQPLLGTIIMPTTILVVVMSGVIRIKQPKETCGEIIKTKTQV